MGEDGEKFYASSVGAGADRLKREMRRSNTKAVFCKGASKDDDADPLGMGDALQCAAPSAVLSSSRSGWGDASVPEG